MSYQEHFPAYIAPIAFDKLLPHYSAIHHNPDQMQEVADRVVEADGHLEPIVVPEEALIYRWAAGGLKLEPMDKSVRHKDSVGEVYQRAVALARPDRMSTPPVTGGTLTGSTYHRLREIDLFKKAPPLKAYVQSMIYPPAEELRIKASPLAWGKQVGEATRRTTNLSIDDKRKLIMSVLRDFPQAIILEPRPDSLEGRKRKLPIES